LASLIAGYKSAVTERINQFRGTPGAPAWQRNYWEHIIRNNADLARIREYIRNNPAAWETDDEHHHQH
jgi:REP element-mobilizing transposase RayT